uniref:Protein croquemort n=1 Tax=Syphacia muris TaxID=451379 RepID=A0A158R499_9BILA
MPSKINKSKICCLFWAFVLLLIGAALIVVGVIVMKKILPDIVHDKKVVGKNSDNSDNTITRIWKNPEYKTFMQYWVYNYTNALEIQHRGAYPDMLEKGPYSYREILTNNVEDWSEDENEVLYRRKSVFRFDAETSCPTCKPDDVFVVPDIIFFRNFLKEEFLNHSNIILVGDFFKPFVEEDDKLYLYIPEICRSLYMVYRNRVNIKGIDGMHFIMPDDIFNYDLDYNCGFCHRLNADMLGKKKGDVCLPNGLLDISQCTTLNPPIAVSKPHFLGAAKEVLSLFPRIKPLEQRDEVSVDVEPNMGVVLKADKRLQINVLVSRYNNTKTYNILLPGAYPIVWLNESFVIDDGTVDMLNTELFGPQKLVKLICWIVGVGCGALLIVIAVVMVVCALCCCNKVRSNISDKTSLLQLYLLIHSMFTSYFRRPKMLWLKTLRRKLLETIKLTMILIIRQTMGSVDGLSSKRNPNSLIVKPPAVQIINNA